MTEIAANDSCSPSRDLYQPTNCPAVRKSYQSYIALISMAILSSAEKRLVLGDIYKILARWQPDRYNTSTTAWRNSIRHNLSLNECFVKAGKAANGKGNAKRLNYAFTLLEDVGFCRPPPTVGYRVQNVELNIS